MRGFENKFTWEAALRARRSVNSVDIVESIGIGRNNCAEMLNISWMPAKARQKWRALRLVDPLLLLSLDDFFGIADVLSGLSLSLVEFALRLGGGISS